MGHQYVDTTKKSFIIKDGSRLLTHFTPVDVLDVNYDVNGDKKS